ncbi:hypothetical protein LshimejAT787_0300470 [Lyophyllum shimeji]|uniref:Uncharacterized protein n=1 Tax=Lyophyllum shimeji TaxID=47721 RepID=A0A9P3PHX9_LYOSH|nr:hypothetical protein LshimejAT787_0300470 [Lyophyllum shimeji]
MVFSLYILGPPTSWWRHLTPADFPGSTAHKFQLPYCETRQQGEASWATLSSDHLHGTWAFFTEPEPSMSRASRLAKGRSDVHDMCLPETSGMTTLERRSAGVLSQSCLGRDNKQFAQLPEDSHQSHIP